MGTDCPQHVLHPAVALQVPASGDVAGRATSLSVLNSVAKLDGSEIDSHRFRWKGKSEAFPPIDPDLADDAIVHAILHEPHFFAAGTVQGHNDFIDVRAGRTGNGKKGRCPVNLFSDEKIRKIGPFGSRAACGAGAGRSALPDKETEIDDFNPSSMIFVRTFSLYPVYPKKGIKSHKRETPFEAFKKAYRSLSTTIFNQAH